MLRQLFTVYFILCSFFNSFVHFLPTAEAASFVHTHFPAWPLEKRLLRSWKKCKVGQAPDTHTSSASAYLSKSWICLACNVYGMSYSWTSIIWTSIIWTLITWTSHTTNTCRLCLMVWHQLLKSIQAEESCLIYQQYVQKIKFWWTKCSDNMWLEPLNPF